MVNFTKLAATAQKLIEANGRSVVLIKTNRDAADSTEPWRGTSAEPHASEDGGQIPVTMAFVPPGGSGFGKKLSDGEGSLSVSVDQVGFLASDSLPSGFTPEDVEQSDSIRDGVDLWKVVTREHLKPADTSVIFVLGLKR